MDPNHKMLLAAVVLIVVMGVAYYFQKKSPVLPTIPPTAPTSTIAPTPGVVTINLSSQNNSGISGTASLRQLQGKVAVSLNLTGSPANSSHPAHIHAGSCPEPGLVKYPLVNPVGGKSDTILDISLAQLKTEVPLAINIHASQTEPKTYVSCGNLVF